jgi:hypothetical protein
MIVIHVSKPFGVKAGTLGESEGSFCTKWYSHRNSLYILDSFEDDNSPKIAVDEVNRRTRSKVYRLTRPWINLILYFHVIVELEHLGWRNNQALLRFVVINLAQLSVMTSISRCDSVYSLSVLLDLVEIDQGVM